ncbi:hypothetical protein K523DRAFT_375189 [Schizophyllum commune Tattone D]|nr:hypothetical protein K523DRAFT_375189 [Schizophyllum commune Tattone D]
MYARHHIPPPPPQPQPRVPPAEWLQAVVRAVRQLPGDPLAVFVQSCVEGPSPVSRRRQPRSDFSATLHTHGHRLPCSVSFVRFSDTSHQSIYEVTMGHRILLKVLQRKNRIDLSADNLFAMLQTAIERGMIEYMINLDVISFAVFRGKASFLDEQGSRFESDPCDVGSLSTIMKAIAGPLRLFSLTR